jgi:hypothetical protein
MSQSQTPLDGALSESMALRLAALKGSSTDAIEATIALWPFGHRVTLHALGLISEAPQEQRYQLGQPSPFTLTDLGGAAIAECARWAGPERIARYAARSGRGQICSR